MCILCACAAAAEALKYAFNDLEYGGNGAVRAHDLGTALRAIGQTPTEADIQELLQDAMLDGQFVVPATHREMLGEISGGGWVAG